MNKLEDLIALSCSDIAIMNGVLEVLIIDVSRVNISYLSKEFGASESYVSKSIKRLKECGYITYEIDNSVKNELRRRIYINYKYLDMIKENDLDQINGLSL